jgi:hypothetical protein
VLHVLLGSLLEMTIWIIRQKGEYINIPRI